ncbi:hypothetical protein ACO229_06490 [Promicromonospora sp. MS192]|uniref:hypothetical protein n=1 Tax=Promicromonospora sp. MS192 TaxID=3412684 RepID=UPI003C2FC375
MVAAVLGLAFSPAAGAAERAAEPGQDVLFAEAQEDALEALIQANLDGVEWTATAPTGETYAPSRNAALVDPFDRWQCDNGVSDHEVNAWTMGDQFPEAVTGVVSLYCGTAATHGYNHIRDGHEAEWAAIAALGDGTWDDFMEFVVEATIIAPHNYSIEGNDKYCYTTPIVLNIDGELWTYYWPVVLSGNNNLVITAYPGIYC